MYEWDFSIILQNYNLLLLGLVNTLKVTVVALVFGIPLGLFMALLRLSSKRWLSLPVGLFIEFFRSTPPLAQLFWIFFALPIIINVEIDPYTASVLTLSIQSSAFFAEVFRAGIISLEKEQWEAGFAIGMRRGQILKRIILPQAVKRMIPAFLERIIELMKTTTLVSTISYADLLFQANAIAQMTYRPLEVFSWPATVFVEVFRNTPALVQIIWFFFALPILLPLNIDSFTAAFLALMLNTVAFAAEIFRGGIQSLSPGQWEAGKALGMTYAQQMRRIILPQAIKRMIPAFTNRGIELAKMTSLASVIAYAELLHQAKTISTINFNPIETYTIVAIIYFMLIYPATLAVRRFEKKSMNKSWERTMHGGHT